MAGSTRQRGFAITAAAAVCILSTPAVAYATAPTGPRLTGSVLKNGIGVLGATVQEYAWPNSAILSTLSKGDTIPMLLLGTAITGSGGAFTVPLPKIPADYRTVGEGNVNLQTEVSAGSAQTSYATALPTAQTTSMAKHSSELFDLGSRTITDSNDVHDTISKRAIPVTVSAGTTTLTALAASNCHYYDTGGRSQHLEAYGQANGNRNVWASLQEYVQHDHSVGIAVEATGGNWSASGSTDVTITGKYDDHAPRHGYSSRRANTLNWYKFGHVCTTSSGGTTRTYSWRAENLADIDDWAQNVGNIFYPYCYKRFKGQSFTYGNGKTVSDTSGATVEGVRLTVSDTWTQDIGVFFEYVTNGEFCGDSSSGTLYSKHFDGDEFTP